MKPDHLPTPPSLLITENSINAIQEFQDDELQTRRSLMIESSIGFATLATRGLDASNFHQRLENLELLLDTPTVDLNQRSTRRSLLKKTLANIALNPRIPK